MYEVITGPAALRLVDPSALVAADPSLSLDGAGVLADAASRAIAVMCNRVFARMTVREGFRAATGRRVIRLRHWPVASITAITEGGATLGVADTRHDLANGQIWRRRAGEEFDVAWPARDVFVSYLSGWETTAAVPPDLRLIAGGLARHFGTLATTDPRVASETIVGVHSITYADPAAGDGSDLPPLFRNALRAAGYIDWRVT